MKTLDEVIESITKHSGLEIRNVRKPDEDKFWVDRSTYMDALHYLRELQLFRETPVMQGIHKAQDEYATYPVEDWNPALTWDELKQMFHKPVWIETTAKKGWNIIVSIDSADMQDTAHRGPKLSGFSKASLGKTWQAYRKERS